MFTKTLEVRYDTYTSHVIFVSTYRLFGFKVATVERLR